MVIVSKKYEEHELDYQIQAESVLLTMILKTNFTQNVICSLFCGSASQMSTHPGHEWDLT